MTSRLEARLAKLERKAEPRPVCRWLSYGETRAPDTIDGRPVIYFRWLEPQDNEPA